MAPSAGGPRHASSIAENDQATPLKDESLVWNSVPAKSSYQEIPQNWRRSTPDGVRGVARRSITG